MERREDVDSALEVAVEHAKDAQHELVEEPPGSAHSVELAYDVEHRSEDVNVLASEAREVTEDEFGAVEAAGSPDRERIGA